MFWKKQAQVFQIQTYHTWSKMYFLKKVVSTGPCNCLKIITSGTRELRREQPVRLRKKRLQLFNHL